MIKSDPQAAVPSFVQGQDQVAIEPAGNAVGGNLAVLQLIQAAGPSPDPNGALAVFADGHCVIPAQALFGCVGREARRV